MQEGVSESTSTNVEAGSSGGGLSTTPDRRRQHDPFFFLCARLPPGVQRRPTPRMHVDPQRVPHTSRATNNSFTSTRVSPSRQRTGGTHAKDHIIANAAHLIHADKVVVVGGTELRESVCLHMCVYDGAGQSPHTGSSAIAALGQRRDSAHARTLPCCPFLSIPCWPLGGASLLWLHRVHISRAVCRVCVRDERRDALPRSHKAKCACDMGRSMRAALSDCRWADCTALGCTGGLCVTNIRSI